MPWMVLGIIAILFLGYMLGTAIIYLMGLTIAFWKEGVLAKIYFGFPILLMICLLINGLIYIANGLINNSDIFFVSILYIGITIAGTQALFVLRKNHDVIKPKNRKIKIPYDPFFYLSLQFFELRTMLNPQLSSVFNIWNDKFIQIKRPKQFRKD